MGTFTYRNLIGFTGGSTQSGLTDNVWISEDGIKWSPITASPTWPVRFIHGTVVYNGKLWTLGGDSPISGPKVNDVWSAPLFADCNDNDLPDECDIAGGTSEDCNTNAIPDDCDPDFDADTLIDDCDPDIDDDGVDNGPDVCDFTPAAAVAAGRVVLDSTSSLYGTIRGDYDGDCNCDLADYADFSLDFTGAIASP